MQGLGQRMQRELGRRGCGGNRGAVLGSRAASIDVPDQFPHFLQGAGQHEDVVARQQQSGDLGQLADRGSVSVRHDLPQAVHGLVQVVHPFPFPAVDLQPQVLHLLFAQLRSVFVLPGAAAVLHPAVTRLAVGCVVTAVFLEHLVGEEPSRRVVHHQVRGGGAAARGTSIGIHFERLRQKSDPKKVNI